MSDLLVRFDNATIVRAGGAAALRDLNWSVRDGETWAVVGPVGSGKTTLTETLQGRHRVEKGAVTWPFLERLRAAGRAVGWPSDVIRRVSFKEESWRFSYAGHYYQERFNVRDPHHNPTLDAFLHGGTAAAESDLAAVADRLGIAALRARPLLELSNGEMRRARIARALLTRPEWLLLDEPFLGVDTAGRAEVSDLLGELLRQGLRLLLVTRPENVPPWVTHVLELEEGTVRAARSAERGVRSEKLPAAGDSQGPPADGDGCRDGGADPDAAPVIEMRDVNVTYGERRVLRDVTWTVRAGERWAVLGPNGAGKSTLLSLVCGDHPQAYANDLRLFGRQRGSGESVWDVKRPIGLVSPELHLYFSEPLSALRAAATGFFDGLACRRLTAEQEQTVRDLFAGFDAAPLLDRPFARLSTGEQRLVLLIRALVKEPPLLILDEPFQGLDDRLIRRLRDWIDERLPAGRTLLFVSHYAEEVPRTVTRRLRLEGGRVAEMR